MRNFETVSCLDAGSFVERARTAAELPAGLPPELKAIWWDARDDLLKALQVVEGEVGLNAVWVRAYLRRRMGDDAIASYWYSKAVRPPASGNFAAERDRMPEILIGRRDSRAAGRSAAEMPLDSSAA